MLDPMMPSIYKVEGYTKNTEDTFTLDLIPSETTQPFVFQPGQFNMLHIFGVGEVPISISGNPDQPLPVRHTTRIVGNVTKHLAKLKKGEPVGLRGPFGSSWPLLAGKDIVIIAGGIGLAPLRPVLAHIMNKRKDFGNVSLCYGTRSPADILFPYEFIEWETQEIDVNVTVDHAPKSWKGNVGVVTTLIPHVTFNTENTCALVCGPEIMMRFVVRALQERGLKDEDIYLSMERNMKCAVGFCGHCQYGPYFICKDGPVFRYKDIQNIFHIEEV